MFCLLNSTSLAQENPTKHLFHMGLVLSGVANTLSFSNVFETKTLYSYSGGFFIEYNLPNGNSLESTVLLMQSQLGYTDKALSGTTNFLEHELLQSCFIFEYVKYLGFNHKLSINPGFYTNFLLSSSSRRNNASYFLNLRTFREIELGLSLSLNIYLLETLFFEIRVTQGIHDLYREIGEPNAIILQRIHVGLAYSMFRHK